MWAPHGTQGPVDAVGQDVPPGTTRPTCRPGDPVEPARRRRMYPPATRRRLHPTRRQGRRPIVTLLQSSPNDTLGVRSPRREPDTSGLVSTDLVRVYLNTIGKTPRPPAERGVGPPRGTGAGLSAGPRLGEKQALTPAPQRD